jgi:hypothetical protein
MVDKNGNKRKALRQVRIQDNDEGFNSNKKSGPSI